MWYYVIHREQTDTRKIKALTIVELNQVKRITAVFYKVKSQSSNVWYEVRHACGSELWSCTCSDHTFRKTECKHIQAVYLSKELRHKMVANSDVDDIETSLEFVCKCGLRTLGKTELERIKLVRSKDTDV